MNLKIQDWIKQGLKNKNINKLTKIQHESFLAISSNKSLIISSPTGTGKTYCYLLPILNSINCEQKTLQAIVVVPTKELAMQVYDEFRYFSKLTNNLKINLILSNDNLNIKNNNLPQIIITTVFKTKQLILDGIDHKTLQTIVYDEVDMLIDFGFYNDLILIDSKLTNQKIQKIFLSASIDIGLASHLKKLIESPLIIGVKENIWENNKIKHNIVSGKNNISKIDTLLNLLKIISPYFAIIFCNTKNEASFVYENMLKERYNVAMLHKDLTSRQRKNIFLNIKANKFQYLVATDLISRGIDIDGVSDVISYTFPSENIWYLHRSGRTGRKNYFGNSYVIYDKKSEHQLNILSKKIKWNFFQISNNILVPKPIKLNYKKNIMNENVSKEISKLYNLKTIKVKPGYKKKLKEAVFKINQKEKRDYLDKKMKKIANKYPK